MEKDRVLPVMGDSRVPSIGELVYDAAVAQRDADWVVLQRDYVSKEKVKVLAVGAIQFLLSAQGCTCGARPEGPDMHPHSLGCPVEFALAQLEEEKL